MNFVLLGIDESDYRRSKGHQIAIDKMIQGFIGNALFLPPSTQRLSHPTHQERDHNQIRGSKCLIMSP